MNSPFPTDETLTQTYLRIDIPSDTLVRSHSNMQKFIDLLPDNCKPIEAEVLASRIIRLRKDGKLPRLRRTQA